LCQLYFEIDQKLGFSEPYVHAVWQSRPIAFHQNQSAGFGGRLDSPTKGSGSATQPSIIAVLMIAGVEEEFLTLKMMPSL